MNWKNKNVLVTGGLGLVGSHLTEKLVSLGANVVVTKSGRFVEVQGTAEMEAFTRDELNQMLDYSSKGCQELIEQIHTLELTPS